ncbi:MAG: DUF2493 domain-containing protein [Clostridiales bacterium]|nr:DUF2493 domain-containing protein [Clostridiales bacterium]
MKTAIVGSRNLFVDLSQYIPADTTEIISGGAKGVDSLAEAYAKEHHIPIRIFYPQYSIYGKAAPLVRNREIVQACDRLIAIWDGTSRGTQYTVQYARTAGKEVVIHQID